MEVCHYLHALGTWLLQSDLFPVGAFVLPCQPRLSGVFTLFILSSLNLVILGVFKAFRGNATALRQVCEK